MRYAQKKDIEDFIKVVSAQSFPFYAQINKTIPSNHRQQQLQYHWYKEVASQSLDSAEDIEAHCKLHIGVPILRKGHPDFKAEYDRHILPLSYETKLALMRSPFSIKITQRMTIEEMSVYLNTIKEKYTHLGYRLTSNSEGWL